MCRNIKPLFNYEPPTSDAEVREAALQFVRKVSGFRQPSRVNSVAFEAAVDEISASTAQLLEALSTSAPPKNRALERAKARGRFQRETAS